MDQDPAIEALRRLIGGSASRRAEVASRCGVNEQYLYQLARGLPLSSGRPRRIGRDLREALDRHYPGWMGEAPPVQAEQRPALETALPVVLEALGRLSPMRLQMARTVLDTLASHPEMAEDAAAELLRLIDGAGSSIASPKVAFRKQAAAG